MVYSDFFFFFLVFKTSQDVLLIWKIIRQGPTVLAVGAEVVFVPILFSLAIFLRLDVG